MTTILEVTGLKKYFPIRKGLFSRTVGYVRAVDGITFSVHAGGIVRAGIEGREHPLEPVFGFGRSKTAQSGEQRGAWKPAEAAES